MAQRSSNSNRRRRMVRKQQIVSAPFAPNRGDEIWYSRQIAALCRPMLKRVYREITALYREAWDSIALKKVATDAAGDEIFFTLDNLLALYEQEFSEKSVLLAGLMVQRQLAAVNRDFPAKIMAVVQTAAAETIETGAAFPSATAAEVIKAVPQVNMFAVPGDIFSVSESVSVAVKASIQENVSLIKSIPSQFFDRITGAVTRSMQAGGSTKQLAAEIKSYAQMTDRRAHNIALDQTRKVYTSLNIRKFQDAGIKKFKWLHVGGSVHPRHYHMADYPEGLNGGVFSIDDPPVIEQKTGIKGFPAQLPYCKCTMCAVFE
jgi:SPP1 gp7 family putative phage head morphogenesis protein